MSTSLGPPARQAAYYAEQQQQQEDERGHPAGNISMGHEKSYPVIKIHSSFKSFLFPPTAFKHRHPTLVYQSGYTGIGTPYDTPSCLYGTQRSIAEMLSVPRSIPPPCIIGDYGHKFRAIKHITSVKIPVRLSHTRASALSCPTQRPITPPSFLSMGSNIFGYGIYSTPGTSFILW